MHALLEGFVQDTLIENQNHRHKTDKIIARTSLFRKNQNPHAKLLRKRLDPGTELKFAKTFAEETLPVLKA